MSSTSLRNILNKVKAAMQPDPVRDWFVIVVITIFFLFLDIFSSFFGFQDIMFKKQPNIIAPTPTPIINRKAINETQQLFDSRASEQTKYESGAYSFTDPSR